MIKKSKEYLDYEKAESDIISECSRKMNVLNGNIPDKSSRIDDIHDERSEKLEKLRGSTRKPTTVMIKYLRNTGGAVSEVIENNVDMDICECVDLECELCQELSDIAQQGSLRWFSAQGNAFGVHVKSCVATVIEFDRQDFSKEVEEIIKDS